MDTSKKYCIDSSALIDFHRGRYPRDIFETIWEKIETIIDEDRLFAPRHVYIELKQKVEETDKTKVDELWNWAKSHKEIFLDPEKEEQLLAGELINKYYQKNELDKLKRMGKEEADPFIVSIAKLRNLSVVTSEGMGYQTKKKKIPEMCRKQNVECLLPVELFKNEGWKFR